MAAPKQKIDWAPAVEEAPRTAAVAGQMPARALQDLLSERHSLLAEPHVDRWSQRRSLAFIAASATALWAGLIFAAHAVITAVA